MRPLLMASILPCVLKLSRFRNLQNRTSSLRATSMAFGTSIASRPQVCCEPLSLKWDEWRRPGTVVMHRKAAGFATYEAGKKSLESDRLEEKLESKSLKSYEKSLDQISSELPREVVSSASSNSLKKAKRARVQGDSTKLISTKNALKKDRSCDPNLRDSISLPNTPAGDIFLEFANFLKSFASKASIRGLPENEGKTPRASKEYLSKVIKILRNDLLFLKTEQLCGFSYGKFLNIVLHYVKSKDKEKLRNILLKYRDLSSKHVHNRLSALKRCYACFPASHRDTLVSLLIKCIDSVDPNMLGTSNNSKEFPFKEDEASFEALPQGSTSLYTTASLKSKQDGLNDGDDPSLDWYSKYAAKLPSYRNISQDVSWRRLSFFRDEILICTQPVSRSQRDDAKHIPEVAVAWEVGKDYLLGRDSLKKAFLSNLPFASTEVIEDVVRQSFSKCGSIKSIEIFEDPLLKEKTISRSRSQEDFSGYNYYLSPSFAIAEFATVEESNLVCRDTFRVFGVRCMDRMVYPEPATRKTTLIATQLPPLLHAEEILRLIAFSLVAELKNLKYSEPQSDRKKLSKSSPAGTSQNKARSSSSFQSSGEGRLSGVSRASVHEDTTSTFAASSDMEGVEKVPPDHTADGVPWFNSDIEIYCTQSALNKEYLECDSSESPEKSWSSTAASLSPDAPSTVNELEMSSWCRLETMNSTRFLPKHFSIQCTSSKPEPIRVKNSQKAVARSPKDLESQSLQHSIEKEDIYSSEMKKKTISAVEKRDDCDEFAPIAPSHESSDAYNTGIITKEHTFNDDASNQNNPKKFDTVSLYDEVCVERTQGVNSLQPASVGFNEIPESIGIPERSDSIAGINSVVALSQQKTDGFENGSAANCAEKESLNSSCLDISEKVRKSSSGSDEINRWIYGADACSASASLEPAERDFSMVFSSAHNLRHADKTNDREDTLRELPYNDLSCASSSEDASSALVGRNHKNSKNNKNDIKPHLTISNKSSLSMTGRMKKGNSFSYSDIMDEMDASRQEMLFSRLIHHLIVSNKRFNRKILMDLMDNRRNPCNEGTMVLRFNSFETAYLAQKLLNQSVMKEFGTRFIFSPRRCVWENGKFVDLSMN